MNFIYRKAQLDDLESIVEFCNELRDEDVKMTFVQIDSVEVLEDWMNDPYMHLYLALAEDGEIAGMFRAKRGEGNKEHSAYIAAAVNKKFRNKNIATELTLFGLEDVKKEGVMIARTKIYSWNHASIATIKKCGFVESGRIVMHQYEEALGKYIDDVIFHKVL